jgi:OOP family OmpA-OmpF porin
LAHLFATQIRKELFMRSKKVLIAGLLGVGVALSASTAFAQAQSPWYIGASLGQSELKDACTGVPSCDEKDTAFRILGGYQINRTWAVEVGFADLGKASDPTGEIKGNAWEIVGVGSFPVANQFSVYGKLGFFRGELKGGGLKETNTDLTYGAGVQYDFARNIGVRGEWQRYTSLGGGAFGGDTDADVLSIGVVYKF